MLVFLSPGTLLNVLLLVIDDVTTFHHWPCGLMDKASVSDTGDCRFKSCQGRSFISVQQLKGRTKIKFCVKNSTMQYGVLVSDTVLCYIEYHVARQRCTTIYELEILEKIPRHSQLIGLCFVFGPNVLMPQISHLSC